MIEIIKKNSRFMEYGNKSVSEKTEIYYFLYFKKEDEIIQKLKFLQSWGLV